MKKYLIIFMLISSYAYADSTICGLPLSTPLTGDECVAVMQAGHTVRSTSEAISNLSSPLILSGIATATANNATPMQASIGGLVSNMISKGTAIGQPGLVVPQGHYSFTSGLTTRPWIKMEPFGTVQFDFSGLSTSGTAIVVENQDQPSGDFADRNSANQAPFLGGTNGSMQMIGPGTSGTNIGLSMGNISSATDSSLRYAQVQNTSIMYFNTCLSMHGYDDYLTKFRDLHIENCGIDILASGITDTNTGEKFSFTDAIIAGSNPGPGLYINSPTGGSFNFSDTSWDFHYGDMIRFGTGAQYGELTINLTNNHFEHIDGYIANSLVPSLQFTDEIVNISNSEYTPTNDTWNGPIAAKFNGVALTLSIDGLNLTGYAVPSHGANTGMYLIDPSVNLLTAKNIVFANYEQMIAAQLLMNDDPLFNGGTVGNDLISSPMSTWTVTSSSGISAKVDNTNVYTAGGGTQSIKFTETASPGSNFYVIQSDRFPVHAGERLIADAAGYGGTSVGNFQVTIKFSCYATNSSIAVYNGSDEGNQLSTEYADTADPAYTGNRLWWAKLDILNTTTVPAGYDSCAEQLTVSQLNAGDSVWIGFTGVNPLN